MKLVILAGGLGTRISEETHLRPKPMIEIGGKPIIWHIMKIYSAFGIKEFIICCGYKGYEIKEYFVNYYLHQSDIQVDMTNKKINILRNETENWSVTLADTGVGSQTGGRLKRIRQYIGEDQFFCMTYGDGLSDVNVTNLIENHKNSNKLVTVTAVRPPGRFGAMRIDGTEVLNFAEKPLGDGGKINGGFFVMNKEALDFINGDEDIWEVDNLPLLAQRKQLNAFLHEGFWQPMDTLRDKNLLEELWQSNDAPWKIW